MCLLGRAAVMSKSAQVWAGPGRAGVLSRAGAAAGAEVTDGGVSAPG